MGKTVRTEKSGTNPLVVIGIFIVAILLIGGVIFLLKIVYPEALTGILGSPDDRLAKENADLQAQLNQSQTEVGDLRAELVKARGSKLAWGLAIGIIGLAILVLLFYVLYWSKRNRGLTLKEAERWAIPEARERYGFPPDYFPMVKLQSRAFERVKHKAGTEDNEVMYFIEMQFARTGKDNRYFHGLHGARMFTVTVALLNKSYLYRQQWYDWMRIDQSMLMAHKQELWGFGLQKTKLDEDILAAVEGARNIQEIQKEFSPQEEAAGGE